MSKYIRGIIDDELFNVKTKRGIIKDIEDNNISTLIIDEKIVTNSNEIRGSEIFEKIKKQVNKFPMVILTNFPDDCMKENLIDPDKIYKKIEFLNIDSEISRELVKKIFLNAKKYMENRDEVEQKIKSLESEIENKGNKTEIVKDIMKNEEILKDLKPTDFRQIEKIMGPEKIKEILDLIKEANNLTE